MAHLGPVGPRWAPYWPHEPCYQGTYGVCWKPTVIWRLVYEKRKQTIWFCTFTPILSMCLVVGLKGRCKVYLSAMDALKAVKSTAKTTALSPVDHVMCHCYSYLRKDPLSFPKREGRHGDYFVHGVVVEITQGAKSDSKVVTGQPSRFGAISCIFAYCSSNAVRETTSICQMVIIMKCVLTYGK